MICKNCGTINDDDALFCVNCGAPIDSQPVNPEPTPVYNPAPAVNQSRAAVKTKSNKGIIALCVIGGIIAISLIALIVVMALQKPVVNNTYNSYVFTFSDIESEFETIEAEYIDADNKIPEEKIEIVLKKDYDYIVAQNKKTERFTEIVMVPEEKSIKCVMADNSAYHHVINDKSYITDENGEVKETEDETPLPQEEVTEEKKENTTAANKALDYSAVEKALKENAFDFVGAYMPFRESDGKIYYYDEEYNPSNIFSFDLSSGKTEKFVSFESGKELGIDMPYTSVYFGEKGVIITISDSNETTLETYEQTHYTYAYDYATKEDISKNAGAGTVEYDGNDIYFMPFNESAPMVEGVGARIEEVGNTDILFYPDGDYEEEFSNAYYQRIITLNGKLFACYYFDGEWGKYRIAVLNDDGSIKDIATDISHYYLSDKYIYYVSDSVMYRIDSESDSLDSEEVCKLNCDSLYFVTDDRVYYFRISSATDGEGSIYYLDFKTGKETEIASGGYAMGGY